MKILILILFLLFGLFMVAFGVYNSSVKGIKVVKKWDRKHLKDWYYVYEDGNFMSLFESEYAATEYAKKLRKPPEGCEGQGGFRD